MTGSTTPSSQNGDEVQIGKFRLVFFASDADREADRCVEAARITIGEAVADLKRGVPGRRHQESKIRFLETEGLVEPERTPSGYRKYSEHDIERLRYVIRAQREHYLPLKVIREHLDAIDRGPRAAGR